MPLVGVPEILPTRLVTFKQGGHQALINVTDFDPAKHIPVEDETAVLPDPEDQVTTDRPSESGDDATAPAVVRKAPRARKGKAPR